MFMRVASKSILRANGAVPIRIAFNVEIKEIVWLQSKEITSNSMISVSLERGSKSSSSKDVQPKQVENDDGLEQWRTDFDESLSIATTLLRNSSGVFQDKKAKLIVRYRKKGILGGGAFKSIGEATIKLHTIACTLGEAFQGGVIGLPLTKCAMEGATLYVRITATAVGEGGIFDNSMSTASDISMKWDSGGRVNPICITVDKTPPSSPVTSARKTKSKSQSSPTSSVVAYSFESRTRSPPAGTSRTKVAEGHVPDVKIPRTSPAGSRPPSLWSLMDGAGGRSKNCSIVQNGSVNDDLNPIQGAVSAGLETSLSSSSSSQDNNISHTNRVDQDHQQQSSYDVNELLESNRVLERNLREVTQSLSDSKVAYDDLYQ
eukprot:gene206-372_t